MFRLISELCKSIAVMNSDGLKMLVTYSRDIIGHDRYRKNEQDMSLQEFYDQADQATELCNRNYIRRQTA